MCSLDTLGRMHSALCMFMESVNPTNYVAKRCLIGFSHTTLHAVYVIKLTVCP
jgi:hypothetical protein